MPVAVGVMAITEVYRPFTLSGFNRPPGQGTLNGSCENQTVRLIRGLVFLPLCALLAGCGTNVQYLLAEESRLTPEADRVTNAAESLNNGIEKPVYDAEDAKLEACRFLHEATVQRMESASPTFGQQFVSDLSSVVVLLVPVGPVERCADSVHAYGDSIAKLERKLVELGVIAKSPSTGPSHNS